MTVYEKLLVVQEHDTALDQLRHRRDNLGQRSELETNAAREAEVDAQIASVNEQREGHLREQRRLEDEVAQVEAKASSEQDTLYSGSVNNPKELQALQEEVDSLRRRQRQLEDRQLDLMEVIEPLTEELDNLDQQRSQLRTVTESLSQSLAADEAAIDEQMATERAAREAAAAEVDEGLLADYENRRARLGGIGIARLSDGSCGGCHLKLPAVELDRIRRLAEDEPVTCEECGRLLVR